MASVASDEMMTLLKELSIIKEMDEAFADGPKTKEERAAYAERQKRRKEITGEMKLLAEARRSATQLEGTN